MEKKLIINKYPVEYCGPKSGISTQEEWAKIRDFQAYQWIVDGTWTYCDFDNYLYSVIEKAKKNENPL